MAFALAKFRAARWGVASAIPGRSFFFNCAQQHRKIKGGFSLVEVVIAIGICAFALIPMVGLMPIGLNTSHQAIDTTIEAQIVQQMTSQAQQTNWSALAALNSSAIVYFDASGNLLPATSSGLAVYKAAFSVAGISSTNTQPSPTTLPGSSSAGSTSTQTLATVTIYVLSIRTLGGITAATPNDVETNTAARKFSVLVADNGL